MNKNLPQSEAVQINILAKLQTTVSSLRSLHQRSTEQQTDNNTLQEIAFSRINEKHTIEIKSLKDEISKKNNYIMELENQQKSQESILITNFKFQFSRLEMALSEKEAQNQSLQKQILRQRQKITQLDSQLQNERQERQFYENNFKKLIDTVKGQLKQITSMNDENQLTSFMSSSVFKQFTERIETFSTMGLENDMKTSLMKDKFTKLKKDFTILMEKNNKLQIQKERLSQKLWTFENGLNGVNKQSKGKNQFGNNLQMGEKLSKLSVKSKNEEIVEMKNTISLNSNNRSSKFKNLNFPSTLLFQKLDQTLNIVTKYVVDLQNVGSALNEINTKITQQQEIWSQVLIVKEMNTKLKDQLNEIKQIKVNPLLSDQLLKNQHSTLYKYFNQKMQQFQQFQNRLQRMQRESVRIIELIERIMYEGIPTSKQIQSSSKQLQQNQNMLRSKLKKQLKQKFQHQKQIYKQQIENYFAQKQTYLNQQINRLNKEIQRLTLKNQDMFKVMTEMEQHQQQILQQAEQQIKQQSIMQQSNKKPIQQTQTQIQSKIPSPRQHIDKQLLSYLQKKTQDLESQLDSQKSLCQRYKKELKFMIQNYKAKSTKFKLTRCNECLLSFLNEKNETKKCDKCKIQLHQGTCYSQHDLNCKKRMPTRPQQQQNNNNTKKNPQQKKRTSNQLANSTVSENMDYF